MTSLHTMPTSFLDNCADDDISRPSTSMSSAMMSHHLTASVCHRRRTRHDGSSSGSSSLNSSTASDVSDVPLNAAERVEMRRLGGLLPRRLVRQQCRRHRRRVIRTDTQTTLEADGMDALDVVRCAAKYIAQLTATVVARVNNGSLPKEALEQIPPHFYRRSSSSPSASASTATVESPNTAASTTRLRRRRQQHHHHQQQQTLGAAYRKRRGGGDADDDHDESGDDASPKRLRYL